MLRRATPIQFDRAATSGRTSPSFITCELEDGARVEVVAKFSAGCDQGNVNLAREVIGACLAGDLGLPIPEPFLLEVHREWAASVPERSRKEQILASSPVAFGSRLVTRQYSPWNIGNLVSDTMLPTAAGILVFDGVIQNPDRRTGNPNCVVQGDKLIIFDHELSFSQSLIIGWKPPWAPGGLKTFEMDGNHIFRTGLQGRTIDYDPIRAAWTSLSDDRISEYAAVLPSEWTDVAATAASAVNLIRDARDNIDGVLAEVKRVLS